jgi:DNA-binding beta-propeller fold protein YncE
MLRRHLLSLALAALVLCALPSGALALEPLSSFGSFGEGPGQFGRMEALEIARDGTVYVADSGNSRIDVFSPAGGFLFAFGKDVNPNGGDTCTAQSGCRAGVGDGSAGTVSEPLAIAIGAEGNLFVPSESNRRIDVFSRAGSFLYAFGKEVNAAQNPADPDVCTATSGCQEGKVSGAAGSLIFPSGLSFDSAGELFVADRGNGRISVFTAAGKFLRAFGKEVNPDKNAANRDLCTAASECQAGRIVGDAGGLAVPADAQVAPDGLLVVSDSNNFRIDILTTGGEFLRAFGKEVNPARDADVCTAASGCVTGASTDRAGGLLFAQRLAIGANNEIYVADTAANRVDQLDIENGFVRAFGTGVIDDADAFQICTLTCRSGLRTPAPGSISDPQDIALDCRGALYVSSENAVAAPPFAQIERFGEPGTPAAPCTSSSPPPPPPPPPLPPPPPSNEFKLLRTVTNERRGTAILVAQVPGPGVLLLTGRGLRTAKREAKAAGTVNLPVEAMAKARLTLAKRGALTLTAKVTFTPTGGTAATQAKALRLRKILRPPPPRPRRR